MNMETCTDHDDMVVVYDSHANRRTLCPFCEMITERDGLKDDIAERDTTISELEGTITSLELGDDE